MTKEYSMLVSCFITFRDLLEADDMYISSKEHTFSSFHQRAQQQHFFSFLFAFLSLARSLRSREKEIFGELFVSDRDRCICVSEWANERTNVKKERERKSSRWFWRYFQFTYEALFSLSLARIQVLPYYCLDIDNDKMMNMELLGNNNWPTIQSIFQYVRNWNEKWY